MILTYQNEGGGGRGQEEEEEEGVATIVFSDGTLFLGFFFLAISYAYTFLKISIDFVSLLSWDIRVSRRPRDNLGKMKAFEPNRSGWSLAVLFPYATPDKLWNVSQMIFSSWCGWEMRKSTQRVGGTAHALRWGAPAIVISLFDFVTSQIYI